MEEGFVIWLTGLPCSGKTTLAKMLENWFKLKGYPVERLDGDTIRQGLTADLGFNKQDRERNIERVTYVAKLLSRNGIVVIAAFVSPYREMRQKIRQEVTNYIEIYVACDLDVCIQRDVKSMYNKAMRGEINDFTGASDLYEEPYCPDVIVHTDKQTEEESFKNILIYLEEIWL